MQMPTYALVQDQEGSLEIADVEAMMAYFSSIMPGFFPNYFPVAWGSYSEMEAEIGYRKTFIERKTAAKELIEMAARGIK